MIFEEFGKCDQTLYRGFDTSSHDQSKLKTKEETNKNRKTLCGDHDYQFVLTSQ